MTITNQIPADIELTYGSHAPSAHEYCAMELVAYVAGEPHSDRPQCACPVIGSFVRTLNDRMDTATRQRLLPYITRIVGTKSTPEIERQRAYIAADFAVREAAPFALDAIKFTAEANQLRHLKPITSASAPRSAAAAAWAASAASAAWSASAQQPIWDAALACLDRMIAAGTTNGDA